MSVLDQLLADLEKMLVVCDGDFEKELPDIAINYLFFNRETIRSLVDQIYSQSDEAQRRTIQQKDSNLNDTAALDGFQVEALYAIELAEIVHKSKGFVELVGENVEALVKALRYGRHLGLQDAKLQLAFSPIDKFGLRKPKGTFAPPLTQAEWNAVRWDASAIVYTDHKKKALADLRDSGLDLEKSEIHFNRSDKKYPDAIADWIDRQVDLLRYKKECDLAAVVVSGQAPERYLNAIAKLLDGEFTNLLDPFRVALLSFHEGVQGSPLKRADRLNLEESIQPFFQAVDALQTKLANGKELPSLEVHERVARVKDTVTPKEIPLPSDSVAPKPPAEKPLVLSLHGIRTRGRWQKELTLCLTRAGFDYDPLDYDFFRAIELIMPWRREAESREFLDKYTNSTKGYRNPPSIIAHSMGTYLVARTLEKYAEVKFDRVIFCGSIVDVGYPWSSLMNAHRVTRVLNDYGGRDFWAKTAEWVVNDAGPSGAKGFKDTANGKVVKRFRPKFRHSDFFYQANYEKTWIPFLQGTDPDEFPAVERRPVNWKFRAVLIAAVTVTVALLALGYHYIESARSTHTPPPQVDAAPSHPR